MEVIFFNKSQKGKWNEFVASNANDGGLLQSWEWGNFQEDLGKKIWRLGVVNEQNNLLATCIAFKDGLSLGQKTIEVYRGPILIKDEKNDIKDTLKLLLDELSKIAKKEKAIVLRIDFGLNRSDDGIVDNAFLGKLNLNRSNRDIQPRSTLVVDLSASKEDILSKMKSKHRYNINLATRKGVKVFVGTGKDFDSFWTLLKTTSRRDGFAIHGRDYYKKLLDYFNGVVKMYLAEYNGKVIAGSLVGCFGQTCVYMHGASDNEFRNVMAPYLLQWNAIVDAKNSGLKFYDLGGVESVDEKSSSQKKWGGITRFKKGFCPNNKTVEFIGLYEMPVNKIRYIVYKYIRMAVKKFK